MSLLHHKVVVGFDINFHCRSVVNWKLPSFFNENGMEFSDDESRWELNHLYFRVDLGFYDTFDH